MKLWLHAVEQIGSYGLDCKKLGEFWLNFITSYWNEYGIGKNNVRQNISEFAIRANISNISKRILIE